MSPEFVRIAKFLAAGVINTAFGYAVYAVLVLARVPEQMALALSFVLGVTFNYFTTARLVFAQRGLRRAPAYVGVYLCIYALNALVLHLMSGAGLAPLLAQAIILPFTAAATYLAMKRVFAPA